MPKTQVEEKQFNIDDHFRELKRQESRYINQRFEQKSDQVVANTHKVYIRNIRNIVIEALQGYLDKRKRGEHLQGKYGIKELCYQWGEWLHFFPKDDGTVKEKRRSKIQALHLEQRDETFLLKATEYFLNDAQEGDKWSVFCETVTRLAEINSYKQALAFYNYCKRHAKGGENLNERIREAKNRIEGPLLSWRQALLQECQDEIKPCYESLVNEIKRKIDESYDDLVNADFKSSDEVVSYLYLLRRDREAWCPVRVTKYPGNETKQTEVEYQLTEKGKEKKAKLEKTIQQKYGIDITQVADDMTLKSEVAGRRIQKATRYAVEPGLQAKLELIRQSDAKTYEDLIDKIDAMDVDINEPIDINDTTHNKFYDTLSPIH